METTLKALVREPAAATDWSTHLTPSELQRLTFFKWHYTLHSKGFEKADAERLMFLKWRYRTGDLTS